jgi:hypothetical protein
MMASRPKIQATAIGNSEALKALHGRLRHRPPMQRETLSEAADLRADRPARVTITVLAHVRAWFEACGDGWATAKAYEQVRALSDAELRKRGLSRSRLGPHILRGRWQRAIAAGLLE